VSGARCGKIEGHGRGWLAGWLAPEIENLSGIWWGSGDGRIGKSGEEGVDGMDGCVVRGADVSVEAY
jgi:hypothetical protein